MEIFEPQEATIRLFVKDDILEYVDEYKADISLSPLEGCVLEKLPNGFKSHFGVRYSNPALSISRNLDESEWELFAYDVYQNTVILGARYNGIETHEESLRFMFFPITKTLVELNGLDEIAFGENLGRHFEGLTDRITGKVYYQSGNISYEVNLADVYDVFRVEVDGASDLQTSEYTWALYEGNAKFRIGFELKVSEQSSGQWEYRFYLLDPEFEIDPSTYEHFVYWKEGVTDLSAEIAKMKATLSCGNLSKDVTEGCSTSYFPEIVYDETVTYTIQFQYSVNEDTYIATAQIVGQPNSVASISPNGFDETNYTDSWRTPFVIPSFTFNVTYKDGTIAEIQPNDSRITYFSDAEHKNKLTAGETVLPETDKVYVMFVDGDSIATSSYRVVPMKDLIVDLEIENQVNIVRGTLPTDYAFSFKAIYLSGKTEENWRNYSILNENDFIVSENHEITFVDKAGGFSKAISFSTIAPENYRVSVKDYGDLKLAINNKKDSVDCRTTVWQVEYYYGGKKLPYVANARYEDIVYSSENAGITSFDGSTKVNVAIEGVATYVNIVATFGNVLMGGDIQAKILLSILDITNVSYIRSGNTILNELSCFRTRYYAGQRFLDINDGSNVNVGFIDADNRISEENIMLNSASNVLNISPTPGTILKEGSYSVTVASIFNSSVYIQYSISVLNKKAYDSLNGKLYLKPYKLEDALSYKQGENTLQFLAGDYVLVGSSYVVWQNGKEVLTGKLSDGEGDGIKVFGYLKNVGKTDVNSSVVLFEDYIPPVEGDSNIICKYPCYDPQASDFVNKCTFGIRFGHNNSLNCLFLSGNADKPNFDIHSAEPNWQNRLDSDSEQVRETAGDYSYFPDETIQKYGEDENAIIGYDIVSDSKLLVLKNKKGNERTIYFRTPKLVTATSASGEQMLGTNGEYLYQEEYQTIMSNSPIGGISPKTICNFNGDTIFLSDQGRIEGLNIEGIIGDSQRQATTRSLYIDQTLFKDSNDEAILYTSGPYCFYDCGKEMFVSHKDEYANGQYEWWKIDSPKANCIFTDEDGTIYFGTNEGSIKRFEKGLFADVDRIFLSSDKAEYKISVGLNGSILVPNYIAEQISTEWTFKQNKKDVIKNNFFHLVANVRNETGVYVKGNKLFIEDDFYSPMFAETINEGLDVFISRDIAGEITLGGIAQTINKNYKPIHFSRDFDDIENVSYFVLDENGNPIDFGNGETFGLCVILDGEYKISKIENGYLYMADGYGNPIRIVTMADSSSSYYSGLLVHKKAVKSEFVTAPFLIDSANYTKTIHKVDIINGSKEPNDLSVCQVSYGNETQKEPRFVYSTFPSSNPTFDFSSMDFVNTSFSKNVSPRVFSIPRFLPNKRFFSLAFESENEKNSVLPGVEITYSYHRLAKGKSE